ncbi:MAG TPA: DNA recombination protein RmuC [Xanthomonadaceae bacterium]|nr:DNA recombination protein RmuC [Xanthomonadaceae bacterium]
MSAPLFTSPLFILVAALAGLAAGGALAALLLRARHAAALERARTEGAVDLATAREAARLQAGERDRLQARADALQGEVEQWRGALEQVRDERAQLAERAARVAPLEARAAELERALADSQDQLASLRARSEAERAQFAEKLAFIEEAKQALGDQFRNLANEILEEKGRRFDEQSQAKLGSLLDPLRQKLTDFQAKVEDVYVKEGKDRSALAEQVRQLLQLNQALSDDAKALTSALKGSNKAQGNWGELVLERVLEASGLRKDHEYRTQESHAQEDGRRLQPDVVIALPEERSLVIDAKMSLVAYEEYCTLEDEAQRNAALSRHLASVRAHIKGLSAKNYQSLYQLRTLDFVLMFVPVEPAFMLAVTHDRDLFREAWERNVLLVSPSTLMFVLRTVAHLWRQEAQNRNAQEIARAGGELYDRLCGFAEELEKLGQRLQQAQHSLDAARTRLAGRRGVLGKAQQLRALGVKPTKALPAGLLAEAAAHEDDEDPVEA